MLLSQSVRTDTAYVVNPLTKRPMMQLLLWIPRRNAPGRSRCLVATEQHISSIFVPFDNLSVIYKSHCGRGGRGVHGVRAQSRLLAVEAVAFMEFVHSP